MLKSLRRWFRRHAEPTIIITPAPLRFTLSLEERTAIRDWLSNPTTALVLGLMEARHPGLHTASVSKVARSEWDQLAAVNLLNRIAGWESYRNAIMSLAATPKSNNGPVDETYPNQ